MRIWWTSGSRLTLVLPTAALGLIGVAGPLLGVIALAGIIMRNSVILVDQIDGDIREADPTPAPLRVLAAE